MKLNNYDVIRQSRTQSDCINIDPLNAEEIKSALLSIKPKVVINLIALTNVDQCETKPVLAYKANYLPAYNIANAIKENDPSIKSIYISTDQLYCKNGYSKEHSIQPLNIYSQTKYLEILQLGIIL